MKEKFEAVTRQSAATDREPQQGLASTILVAGLGNPFLGDDGFGTEVTRRLREQELPSQVNVTDFSIRGFDLADALHDNYDAVILINAAPRGEKPGTLFVIEPNLDELKQAESQAILPESHGVNDKVLGLLRQIEEDAFKQLIIVGCEPVSTNLGTTQASLSAPVTAAVDETVEIVECLIAGMLGESPTGRDS